MMVIEKRVHAQQCAAGNCTRLGIWDGTKDVLALHISGAEQFAIGRCTDLAQ